MLKMKVKYKYMVLFVVLDVWLVNVILGFRILFHGWLDFMKV
ncbi:hypothetical protein HanXRQr2_Chr07g0285461 [Helianthus annuus]|uniref:Uncharacterized protein n=1 Tax=Helianthus annuus TaxID=4232 RepID=A0A9K3IJQ0_HELAN|nr:hypothetical protein HanXRQr2_Chr07g0285461 [Helianthus annuus]